MSKLKPDMDKWIHRAVPLYIIGMAANPFEEFLPKGIWSGVGLVIAMLVLVFMMLSLYHGGARFCEYCADDTPLDGDAAAVKKRPTLRFFHQSRSWWGFSYLVTFVMVPLVLHRIWPLFIGEVLLTPGFLWFIWSGRVHGLLKPWCPYCHHGRGKGGDGLWEPSPEPSDGRPLPVGPSNG